MRKLIHYFVTYEVLANLILLLLIGSGVFALFNLQSTLFPKQDPKFVVVQATYPGASPQEIEESIVLKVEENLEGISGIKRVRSESQEHNGTIRIELESNVNAYEVHQEIKNAIDRVSSFPEDMERIVAFIEEPVNPAGTMAITGEVPLSVLKATADRVEDDLRRMDDISRINVFGYSPPEIEITIKENVLQRYNLTLAEVYQTVESENVRLSGGEIRGPQKNYKIRLDQKEYYAKYLNPIVVRASSDGKRVLLRDIAQVRDTFSEDTEEAYLDGQRAIFISVNTTNEENIQHAADQMHAYIDKFNTQHGSIQAVLVDDTTQRLDDRISVLQENGLLGFVLVMLILGLFLRIRLAFWVALGIPISFCGMFILALYYGVTINFFSVFGMIIVLGILVDDGIVVGENIYQKYQEGLSPVKAAIEGTMEVLHAVISAVLTTILALSFFFFIPARVGELFADVSFIVTATLLISLIEVAILLPAHLAHSKALKRKNKKTGIQENIAQWVFRVRDRFYIPLLRFALNNKVFVMLTVVSILIITMASVGGGIIRTNYFPQLERNEVEVTLQLKQGFNAKVTKDRADQIIEAAKRLNDRYVEQFDMDRDLFQRTELRIGPASNQASIIFYMIPSEERMIRSFKVASDLREETGTIPEAEQLSYTKEKQIGKPVEISLISSDFQRLQVGAQYLKQRLEDIPELQDIIDNQNASEPEIQIALTDNARLLGFSNREVMQQVRAGFFGHEVQRLQRGKNEIKVWVRYADEDRASMDKLMDMRIRDSQGNTYPLSEIAELNHRLGLVSINHRDGLREIKVEADLANQKASAPDILRNIRTEIMPDLEQRFPAISYLFEGQVLQSREVFTAAQTVLPILLALIFSVIVVAFRSYLQSFMMFVLIPFGMIGAIWGHYIHDIALGILSLLGFLALIGILVNDGLVFVTTLNSNLKKGHPYYEALIESGRSRFRPVILTSITTIAGLAPLIFEKSFQAQFLIPMAVTVAYGLLFTTILILVIMPILLVTVNNIKRALHWVWNGEWISHEAVESAVMERTWESEDDQ
ncbi:MAG: efflux RND transporter permease subunit [Bacteroidota bacterium]